MLVSSIITEKLPNKRWRRNDKIMQYRAISKLHARDKKVQLTDAVKLQKKVAHQLKSLKSDVKNYYEILNANVSGSNKNVYLKLFSHRDIQLLQQKLTPVETLEVVCQDTHCKEKYLNKVTYIKKKKLKKLFDLHLNTFTFNAHFTEEEMKLDYKRQSLTKYYEHILSKHKTVLAIQKSYQKIFQELKQDYVYYDYVVKVLNVDQNDQHRVICRMTKKRQIWSDNLVEMKSKYKHLLEDVMKKMKEREKNIEEVEEQVQDLWKFAQSVVRVESDFDFTKCKSSNNMDSSISQKLKELYDIFERVKTSLLVQSYEELLSRLENQVSQKVCLTNQFNRYINQRDDLIRKINHGDAILSSLNHSVISTTGEYKLKKEQIYDKIKLQTSTTIECSKLIKRHEELLVEMKFALQHLLSMLTLINTPKTVDKVREARMMTRMFNTNDLKQMTKFNLKPQNFEITTEMNSNKNIQMNVVALLAEISRRAGILYAVTRIDLSKAKEEAASELYQTYIANYRSQLLLSHEDIEPTNISIEYDVVDDNIPTRTDIKMLSKKIVDEQLKS